MINSPMHERPALDVSVTETTGGYAVTPLSKRAQYWIDEQFYDDPNWIGYFLQVEECDMPRLQEQMENAGLAVDGPLNEWREAA